MPDVLIIVNPSAGSGRAGRCWLRVQRMLAREGLTFSSVRHDGLAGLGELAAHAARAGHTVIGAMGGDGTVREVAGGLAGTGAALGIIPAGTDNGRYWEKGLRIAAAADPADGQFDVSLVQAAS